ncbi:D-sedoheptulose 7-phosphate isomerase [Amycolatopsis marina]|uniref:D-sedoheptulose 7-phosphate isomerase n=1 Tax=Amycolatopsis marina TaxID=490629 RepID=A0A1I0Y0S6_9PSEU|nr:SIS domain-containing protein [Amycolatopsis marina]SFB06477.1 D-sedoheptulose 7-phosphate isomerase [Amycolatopsis marina]
MTSTMPDIARGHIATLMDTLAALRGQSGRIERWGRLLAERLGSGSRLLAAGAGESAADAEHLTAELIALDRGDRNPLSAIALRTTGPDLAGFGYSEKDGEDALARQVTAHARARDVVVLLSPSGRDHTLVLAARAAHRSGATTLAFTGHCPNQLANAVEDAVCLPGTTASVQESMLAAVNLLYEAVELAAPAFEGMPVSRAVE